MTIVPMAIETSMEGIFDGVDIIAEAMAFAIVTTTMEFFAKSSILPHSLFLPRRMSQLRRRSLGSLSLFLLSFPLPQREVFLPWWPKPKEFLLLPLC
nr:hypothetical protein CFP56_02247 [Quercus suber]